MGRRLRRGSWGMPLHALVSGTRPAASGVHAPVLPGSSPPCRLVGLGAPKSPPPGAPRHPCPLCGCPLRASRRPPRLTAPLPPPPRLPAAAGIEHLLFLNPGPAGLDAAADFLTQLAALAESSAAGGIQSSAGIVLSACSHGDQGGCLACSHVLMTRFAAEQQVAMFMATKPCEALTDADPRLPLAAHASLSWQVAPAEETNVSGGLLT